MEANADLVKEIAGEDVSEADYAQRMVGLISQRRKLIAEQKAKAQRDKPMTQAQQRQYMATYLKNQGGWKLAQIKKLTDEELKEKFEYLMRSMERFVPMDTEKESRKRTGVELQTESSKKLKSDTREDVSVPKEKDKESVKREEEFEIKKPVLRYTKRKSLARKGLQKKPESAKSGTEEDVEAYMEERVDEPSSEEFPMSSIPQGPAPAKIVKWQIIKTGKRGAYQIIREDNTDVVYVNFQGLLNDLTRDDLKELYRLMMLKYGDNRPEEEFERVLWGDLKTMFDPPSEEDAIWKLPHQQQILNWRYFHSCSVHCLTVEAAHIYMLTEVKYPLPPRVCKAMLEKKLLGDRKDESTMSNRHKDWLVQEQTALGKDFSNPFMADNLPKIVWLSTHHIYVCKELASPQGYGLSPRSYEEKGFLQNDITWAQGVRFRPKTSRFEAWNEENAMSTSVGIRAEVPVKMPPRRNRPLTEAYEQEFEQRVMERMEERLDQFVDQLANRMNNMMNPRRRRDRNSRGSVGEESENLFFNGDGSSSDEQPDRPRQNQREDNRH
ncbi:hypothetical protein Tco_0586047 [Tanacetum coccineum]